MDVDLRSKAVFINKPARKIVGKLNALGAGKFTWKRDLDLPGNARIFPRFRFLDLVPEPQTVPCGRALWHHQQRGIAYNALAVSVFVQHAVALIKHVYACAVARSGHSAVAFSSAEDFYRQMKYGHGVLTLY